MKSKRYASSIFLSALFLLVLLFGFAYLADCFYQPNEAKADMLSIITMPNHPKIGDTQDYVESVWGKWMNPLHLPFFTSYRPNVYLDPDDEPVIALSYRNRILHEIHFSLSKGGIQFTLDDAVVLAKEYIDQSFLLNNYKLTSSQHYVHNDGTGEYYQSYVQKDSNRNDLPFKTLFIRFYHDQYSNVYSLSFHYKGPKSSYIDDDRFFTEWDIDLWAN